MAAQSRLLVREMESCSEGVILVNPRTARWPLLYTNEGFARAAGAHSHLHIRRVLRLSAQPTDRCLRQIILLASGLSVDFGSGTLFWDEFEAANGYLVTHRALPKETLPTWRLTIGPN